MRHRSALTLLAASLLLGCAAVPSHAEGTPAQQNAQPAPENGANPSARPPAAGENQKSSATNDQAGPSAARPAADQNSQGQQATHSVSGRGGKEEPGSHAPSDDTAVFVNGRLNVEGAPAEGQTVPAKFSQRNDKIDNVPIMAMPLGLTDGQKKRIVDSVKLAGKPVQTTAAKPAQELPWTIAVHDLPNATEGLSMPDVGYVRTPDRILLVRSSNRIVVDEITN